MVICGYIVVIACYQWLYVVTSIRVVMYEYNHHVNI